MKPWIKLYRLESARFQALPLMARAIYKQILIYVDDDGVIHLGGRTPEEAIARLAGADRSDRRMLAKHVPDLIKNGYLALDEDRLIAPKFAERQESKKPRKNRERATTVPRTNHDAATNVPRQCHETSTKSPEPLKTGQGDKEEDKDIEGDKNNTHSDGAEVGAVEPTTGEQIKELESRYPSDLCADVREGIALCRRNGKVSDSVWLKTLRQLEAHPADAVVEAMRTYAGRYADGEKGEAYLVGIARRAAKGRTGVQMPLSAAAHGLSPVSSAEEHERDAARPLPAWMMRQRETVHA